MDKNRKRRLAIETVIDARVKRMEPARKQGPMRHYCVTLQTGEWTPPSPLPEKVRYVIYQVESAPTTGTIHTHVYVEFDKPVRRPQAIKLLSLPEEAHFEARQGTRTQARDYCRKEESRVSGPFEFGTWVPDEAGIARKRRMTETDFLNEVLTEENVRDETLTYNVLVRRYPSMFEHGHRIFDYAWNQLLRMRAPPVDIKLNQWELMVVRYLRARPQTRRIYWIWSRESGTGKTTFVNYLADKAFPDQVRQLPWKWVDAIYSYKGERIITFNLPRDFIAAAQMSAPGLRSNREDILRAYMSILERFSDIGYHDSGKYDSCQKIVNAHVIVTANEPPPYEMLPYRFVEVHIDVGSIIRPHHELAYKGDLESVVSDREASGSESDFECSFDPSFHHPAMDDLA